MCGAQVCPETPTQLPADTQTQKGPRLGLQTQTRYLKDRLHSYKVLSLVLITTEKRFQIRPFLFPSSFPTRCRSKNHEPGLQRPSYVPQSSHLSDDRVSSYNLPAIQLMTESLQRWKPHFVQKRLWSDSYSLHWI